jgi:hypothetical protein
MRHPRPYPRTLMVTAAVIAGLATTGAVAFASTQPSHTQPTQVQLSNAQNPTERPQNRRSACNLARHWALRILTHGGASSQRVRCPSLRNRHGGSARPARASHGTTPLSRRSGAHGHR